VTQNGPKNPNWKGGISRDNMRYKREQRRRYPERIYARERVRRKVRSGDLVPHPCEVCGDANAQAHHPDYARPLDVRWLCRAHHQAEDAANPHPRKSPEVEHPTSFAWRGKVRSW
jgi:hypothetical protein